MAGVCCRHNQPDRDRGYHYLHSTFCDLIITGLVGLRPEADNQELLVVNPLVPSHVPDMLWFALDNVLLRGFEVAVAWDLTGSVLKTGQGLVILVNGCIAARTEQLQRIEVSLGLYQVPCCSSAMRTGAACMQDSFGASALKEL